MLNLLKKYRDVIILLVILVLGFAARLYNFQAPIADWHAWRQADTSAVSRFLVKDNFDVFHPRFYDLSNVPSGIHENPEGYRFVEFPIYNILQAFSYKLIGILTIEQWGRLVTIFSSLGSAFILYLIVKKHLNSTAGIFAAFFYTFLPFSVFYGRTILPDTTTVFSILLTIHFFDKWTDKENRLNFVLSLFFAAISLLLKPFAIFFFLPLIYLSYGKFGKNIWKNGWLISFAILSFLPLALWRIWMLQYPGGIPQSGWLLNGSGIRFRPAFFQWIFAERLSKLILGYFGLPVLFFGIFLKVSKKSYLFFFSFLASSFLYVFVIATGNVQHDYYQILIMPTISIFLSLGAYYLFENKGNINKYVSKGILAISILFMFYFSWINIRDYYSIQHEEIIRGGKVVDRILPKDAKVLIPNAIGDTTALYFMDRQGWSSFEKPLPQLIKMGADYMIFFSPYEKELEFQKKYKLFYSSADLIIFDLRQKP